MRALPMMWNETICACPGPQPQASAALMKLSTSPLAPGS
jgi:hypothetical protein